MPVRAPRARLTAFLTTLAVGATGAVAVLLPGVPAPAGQDLQAVHPLTVPVLAGAAAMSPLIRPLNVAPSLQLTDWSPAPELTGPGLLTAPDTTSSPTPTSPVLR